jgi:hypothetical protein
MQPRDQRIGLLLFGGPEGDLDLDSHTRCREAEDLAAGVVPRYRGEPGVHAGERGRLLHPAEGAGLCSARISAAILFGFAVYGAITAISG